MGFLQRFFWSLRPYSKYSDTTSFTRGITHVRTDAGARTQRHSSMRVGVNVGEQILFKSKRTGTHERTDACVSQNV